MKTIKGYEGVYSISRDGKILIHKRKRGDGRTYSEKYMKTQVNNAGYETCALFDFKGHVKRLYVHRLVAQTYIPNKYGFRTVNHIDGNKLNNKVENLEWCTYSDNCKHSFRVLGRVTWNKGRKKERSILKCKWCNEDFKQRRAGQILCSRKCTGQHNGNSKKIHLLEQKLISL